MWGLRRMTLKAPSICTVEQKPLLAAVLTGVQHQLLWEWGFQSMHEKPASLWKKWDRGTRDEGSGSSRVSRCSKPMQTVWKELSCFYLYHQPRCIVCTNDGFLGCCQAYLQEWHSWEKWAWLDWIWGYFHATKNSYGFVFTLDMYRYVNFR